VVCVVNVVGGRVGRVCVLHCGVWAVWVYKRRWEGVCCVKGNCGNCPQCGSVCGM